MRILPFALKTLYTLELSPSNHVKVNEEEKWSLLKQGIKFIDVTNYFSKPEIPVAIYNYPNETFYDDEVYRISEKINHTVMYEKLAKLTSFYTRYYKSKHGVESAQWLYEELENIVNDVEFIHLNKFEHKGWKQFSMIVRIEGKKNRDNIVVIGSHHDSINLILPSVLGAPGADDNGSGTVTNLEALRLYVEYIKEDGMKNRPDNTIEFHFYSAEEGGLLGSMDVFSRYREENKRVMCMLQQDMTGYVSDEKNEHVGVITDYVSVEFTEFLKLIINKYLSIPYLETKCGYACSDHGSAIRNGYPAGFVIEGEFKNTNHYIHSTMDTIDRLSVGHMGEHSKLVLGSVMETCALGWVLKGVKRQKTKDKRQKTKDKRQKTKDKDKRQKTKDKKNSIYMYKLVLLYIYIYALTTLASWSIFNFHFIYIFTTTSLVTLCKNTPGGDG
ncbi:hypothetical protein TBLA_0A06920 [Henningerozyma blattae CBS 6284]|uniref:Peptide hydrolase n=1 Tax=Henningerozyma blattae (strain ATCC 34711 / CBS 6284 / DSM 70876 / NBRC 10599 / NRRL Y-10934 / UCD 77-7) TaxID=1071380 RepID=I2GWI1_HENB6|nr:hypothetical protein TBLA_0A06920 [Tetrapisispora blattae CBS 6284]CCH58483.1 hypothetical protein TBLA_0A06920 [Tetrapisispora blattae CBS 6284]